MRRYTVHVTSSAIEDIEEIADFYYEIVGEESAAKFSDAVIDTVESLDTFPEANSYFDKKNNLRRVFVDGYKVSVVYIVDKGIYEVIAFGAFHTLEEPNRYSQRLVQRLKDLGK